MFVAAQHPSFRFLLDAQALAGMNRPEAQAQTVLEEFVLIFRFADLCCHAGFP